MNKKGNVSRIPARECFTDSGQRGPICPPSFPRCPAGLSGLRWALRPGPASPAPEAGSALRAGLSPRGLSDRPLTRPPRSQPPAKTGSAPAFGLVPRPKPVLAPLWPPAVPAPGAGVGARGAVEPLRGPAAPWPPLRAGCGALVPPTREGHSRCPSPIRLSICGLLRFTHLRPNIDRMEE